MPQFPSGLALFKSGIRCKIWLTLGAGGIAIQAVTLSFFRFGGVGARLWALAQMGAARFALARAADIGFWKLCGSGVGEGFTPLPNTAVYAILATWPDEATARRRIAGLEVFRRYRARADEAWTLYLSPVSARGAWSGATPFIPSDDAPADGPIAALTRATVRPAAMARFWRREPAISAAIGANPDVLFKIGIGEAPLVRQVTFSIWPDAASMAAFARADGPHARAIRAVREGGWFAEELYARFRILGEEGRWGEDNPLTARRDAVAA